MEQQSSSAAVDRVDALDPYRKPIRRDTVLGPAGPKPKGGTTTTVDDTITGAPRSTNNSDKQRNPRGTEHAMPSGGTLV